MKRFQKTAYLKKEEICTLAMSFNTTRKTVENWFSYMRRNKAAREMLNQSEYCSVK